MKVVLLHCNTTSVDYSITFYLDYSFFYLSLCVQVYFYDVMKYVSVNYT